MTVALFVSSLVSLGAVQATSEPPRDLVSEATDAGSSSDVRAVAPSDAGDDAGAFALTSDARASMGPAFSTRSSITLGPPAVEGEVPSRTKPADEEFQAVTAIDLEAGTSPLYAADPILLGIGFGVRGRIPAGEIVGPGLRLGFLTTALVHMRDERTGVGTQKALFGGTPVFADVDLYFALGPIVRAGLGTRAGVYVAPHLYPLFAVGAGLAADVGRQRVELVARLQPLPTGIGNAATSGEEVWTRSRWMIVPTLRVSLPIGK